MGIDATRFASVSRDCRFVSLSPPLKLEYDCLDRHGPSDIYHAILWQTLPPIPAAHTVLLKCRWKDQRWGNRKGMISIVANGGRAPNDYKPWSNQVLCGNEPAPHDLSPLMLKFHSTSIKKNDQEQQPYGIWIRIGGGGGHRLCIEELSVRALVYR